MRSPEDLWRDTFRKYIRANPFLSFREVHRKTIQDFFRAFGIANDVDGCIDAVFDEYRSSSAYPEVSAVLRDLEQEVPVAVVSNMDTTALLGALQRNGLTFTFIITSDEEQRYKPDPSLFQRAVRYLGLPAANVLHVGSSYAAFTILSKCATSSGILGRDRSSLGARSMARGYHAASRICRASWAPRSGRGLRRTD